MPVEIIAIILLEWTMLEWFAPAIARQICRYLKEITDSSPYLWAKICLPYHSLATAEEVRDWLKRAKSVPKEILLETEDVDIVSAALEGAKEATSLIYRIPTFKEILPHEEEVIRLPIQMPQLRHLHLDTSNIYDFLSLGNIFGLYNPLHSAHFPCLTVLHLFFVDLIKFHITPGLFPAIRRLLLHSVCGPILDLVQVCSGTLEHLRVTIYITYDGELYPDVRIYLPNLKVLIVEDALGIVPNIEAPTLRLIYADLAEIDGSTRIFSSVVEWVTRQCPSLFQDMDMTEHLQNMPNLRHLMIFQHTETLKRCFASLRDNPRICPHLHFIEVVDVADTSPPFKLDTDSKEFLKACVAWRAESVPEFTLQFVENKVHVTRLDQYYTTSVSSSIVMHHYLSHHAF